MPLFATSSSKARTAFCSELIIVMSMTMPVPMTANAANSGFAVRSTLTATTPIKAIPMSLTSIMRGRGCF